VDLTRPLIRVDARTIPEDDEHPLSLAEVLHVSSKTAWRIVRDRKVQSVKIGARRLVIPESVEAYLQAGGDR